MKPIKIPKMSKIVYLGTEASGLYAKALIKAAEIAKESGHEVVVINGLEMDKEDVKQKIMAVAGTGINFDEQIPELAKERLYYEDTISLKTKNQPFYYGVPKSKKRGKRR